MSTLAHPAVTVCNHPLLKHNLSILRDKNTSTEQFRTTMRRIGQFIFMQATADLPLSRTIVETPIAKTECHILPPDVPIIIAPILRAGLVLSDVAIEVLPTASVYHIGLYRDEETLKPVTYYNKLPSTIDYSVARIFVLDPMLATGGSAVAAVDIIKQLGTEAKNITVVSVISAPEGIQHLAEQHPGIRIFTGAVDERLNDKAYIVPGLGDAGDRTFGTV
ncbi:MAG TPA: uracil phosphoribosyltransferase [Coleofasciculaceae cyanobacterium]|jgi:uracil phosphoribosyltransferase